MPNYNRNHNFDNHPSAPGMLSLFCKAADFDKHCNSRPPLFLNMRVYTVGGLGGLLLVGCSCAAWGIRWFGNDVMQVNAE